MEPFSLSLPRATFAATTVENLALFAGGIVNTSSIINGAVDENTTAVVDIYNSMGTGTPHNFLLLAIG
jgi:hypothetical protein